MTTTDIDVEALRAQIDAEDDPSGKADLYDRLSYALQMTDPAGSFTASAAALRIETGLGDVSRISRSCLRIGDYFRHVGKYRSASRWIMKAWRAVADLDGHHFRKAEILRRQAALHHAWGDNVSALDALERSLAICRRPDAPYDDQGQVAATLGYMGEIYTEVGDLGRALQVFSEALETFEERNNRRAVGKTLFNIGRVHAALGDRDEALAVFERSLAHSRSVGNRFAEANCLIQIGIILREQGSLAAALAQHDGALELCRQIENRFGQASALCEIARTLRQMGEWERAIASIDEARTIFEEIGDHGGRLQALQRIGEIHLHDLMYRDAIEAFLRAHALAAEIGHRKEQCELQRLLSEAHERIGELGSALAFFKLHAALKEEIAGEETRRSAEVRRMREAIEQSEMKRQILQLKTEQLEREMEQKMSELNVMALRLARNGEVLMKLRDRITHFSRLNGAEDAGLFAQGLLGEIRASIQQESEWEMFERQFSSVHQGFLHTISERHPDLTPTELKVCALLKVNLSSKEIGNILNISARTVDNHRLNIRRKLGLAAEANLTTHLASR